VRRLYGLLIATLLVGAYAPASAWGLTLGDLATTTPTTCSYSSSIWLMQYASTTAQYAVPAGGGVITSWNTSFGQAGEPVELVVSSAFDTTVFTATVRGVDSEILPSPIPAGNVSTFTLAHPLAVQAGDTIGLYVFGGAPTPCGFTGATGDTVAAGAEDPSPGGTIQAVTGGPNMLVNVSANLVQSVDMSLTGSAYPSAITRGDIAQLSFPVSGGPIATATFTDTVPTGLTPVSASAGGGSCTISGQSVSCTVDSSPTTVHVVVRGSSPGLYRVSGRVQSPLADPNPSNNSATATLMVVSSTSSCVIPKLRGAPLAVAKAVLPLVNCTLGKVRKASSKRIPKRSVISTSPGAGTTAPPGTAVTVTVSGRPKARKKHHH
jgi:Domain of unknown function DUF11/PASTA domain